MRENIYPKYLNLSLIILVSLLVPTSSAASPWTQWGGANRDFGSSQGEDSLSIEVDTLDWGHLGPRVLWWKELEPGYSAIVSDGERLYTMFRHGAKEGVVALMPEDGTELWRHTYAAPTDHLGPIDKSYGDAPQATPMVADGRVYGFGFTGVLTAVDAKDGSPLWSQDLTSEYGVNVPYFGHAASPLRVGDTVVVLAGGAHAFDLKTGSLRWKNRDFEASYASPILVEGPNGPQLVAAAAGEVIGLDPQNGRLLWRHEHANQHRTFLSTPVAGPADMIFASAYFLGSIGLRLGADGGVSESWELANLQVSQSNAVRSGEMIVASHNRNLVAVNLKSGDILWKEKGVRRSNLVRRGERTLLLDDRGALTLASLDRNSYHALSSAQILEGRSWTAPTVIGRRLYARNLSAAVAVDWTVSARNREETLAGRRTDPSVALKTTAPETFLTVRKKAQKALLRSDGEDLQAIFAEFEPWIADPTMAIYGHYYRGLIAWQLSSSTPREQQLRWIDQAVESLTAALDQREDFVEAHAVLAAIYPSYRRVDRARMAVVGPLGDEHLARALELEPENPRVLMFQALDLIYSPPQYGGDPERGLEIFALAIDKADAESRDSKDPRPSWGKSTARFLCAQVLAQRGEKDQARGLLQEALRLTPELEDARQLLASLDRDSGQ